MNLEELPTRWAGAVSLLALIPVLWYGFGRPSTAGFVTAVNVVIIFAALYVATEPVAGHETDHHGDGNTGENGDGNGVGA